MIKQHSFSFVDTLKQNSFIQWLISEKVVLTIIVINTVVLFVDAFPAIRQTTFGEILFWIDYVCIVFFVIEAIIKIWILKFSTYWRSGWNKLDLIIVIAGFPFLISPFLHNINLEAFSIILLLRLGRFLRFWRMLRFVPNSGHILKGVVRALKASVGVFLVLLGLNLILAMGANMLFHTVAPQYFGDPILSIYSMFKVFTIEGWYEIPDQLADEGISTTYLVLMRCYFSVAVLVGGILGLSLANAVFVDEMTTDNNDHLEEMVEKLQLELEKTNKERSQTEAQQWKTLQETLKEMQREIASLKK